MSTPGSRVRFPALAAVGFSIGSVLVATSVSTAGPASGAPASSSESGPSSTPSGGDPSLTTSMATLYSEDDYSEGPIPDEFTGIGPFTSSFPCGGLSVDESAEIVPGVLGASIDGPCYYYVHIEASEGNTDITDAFSVDVVDIDSDAEGAEGAEGAEWLADAEQQYYNRVYPSGRPPQGEGCEPLDGLGVDARWCWADDDRSHPTLLLLTPHLGIEIVGWDTIEDMAGDDEQREREILFDIAERILDNAGLAGKV